MGGRLVARAGGKLEEEVVVVVVEDGMVLDATTRPHLTSPRLTEPSRVQYVGTKQHCTVRRRHPFHPLRTGICQHLQQARARQFGPASGWAEPPRWADGDPGMGSLGQALWGPGGGSCWWRASGPVDPCRWSWAVRRLQGSRSMDGCWGVVVVHRCWRRGARDS